MWRCQEIVGSNGPWPNPGRLGWGEVREWKKEKEIKEEDRGEAGVREEERENREKRKGGKRKRSKGKRQEQRRKKEEKKRGKEKKERKEKKVEM